MLMTRLPAAEKVDRRRRSPAPTRWPSGISFAVAVGCCGPAGLLAWLAGAGVHPVAGLVLFAAVGAALAAVSSGLGAVAAALLMWAGDDGFVIHRFGVLYLDAPSVQALAVIGCITLGAYAAAGLVRRVPRAGS
jgi:hypothetical protein